MVEARSCDSALAAQADARNENIRGPHCPDKNWRASGKRSRIRGRGCACHVDVAAGIERDRRAVRNKSERGTGYSCAAFVACAS